MLGAYNFAWNYIYILTNYFDLTFVDLAPASLQLITFYLSFSEIFAFLTLLKFFMCFAIFTFLGKSKKIELRFVLLLRLPNEFGRL